MHSSGESDGAVVPMKPSNKATGQAPEAAERVEGRASTKENVQQARAVPAQHGAAASQGLKGVRKVAKERKQERFTTLLHHLTVNLLRDSYYALKREAAPGVDGVRWAEYEDGLEPRLKDLHERVHRGSCTNGCTGEATGRRRHGGFICRNRTVGKGRSASQRWKIKSYSKRW